MADGAGTSASRPSRISSQKALSLLSQWNSDSESDGDDSIDSYSSQDDDQSSSASSDSDDNAGPATTQWQRQGQPRGRGGGPRHRGNSQRGTGAPVPARGRPQIGNNDWKDISGSQNDTSGHSFRFTLNKPPGVNGNLDAESSPIDCLNELLTHDVLQQIKNMINEFAARKLIINNPARRRSVYSNWKPVTDSELLKFLAVLIAMGLNKRPSVKDYWSKFPVNFSPWFGQMFPTDWFEAIYHTMLHASDVESVAKEKIEPFLNTLLEKFQVAFYPFIDVAIDEMVIGWKGRWKYKQYNAAKPKKHHIKIFGLCDSVTGYAYNILIYFGKDTSYNLTNGDVSGQSEKVFEYLLQPLGKGHHVFADRYYTTHALMKYLISKKMYCTCTLNLNRKNFPRTQNIEA